MQTKHCQLSFLENMADPVNLSDRVMQRRNRLKRIVKRRILYIKNFLYRSRKHLPDQKVASRLNLKPGDAVRIKNEKDIQATLNLWNQLKGCAFMKEMWPYCGTIQKVYKPVEKFLDERDYLIKKCSGMVLLEGVFCEGTKDFGPCDRSCFFFWREEWLEKI